METATDGWKDIAAQAGVDNEPSRAVAQARAAQKQVMALEDLSSSVFNAQKHISQRLDTLNEKLDANSKSSESLGKKTFWLTVALVAATVVQAIAAIIVALNA